MNERLHLLMPCSKFGLAQRVVRFLLEEMDPHPFEVRLHLLVQNREADPDGYGKIDEALAWLVDGWVWTPSDDSLHHPSLFRRLADVLFPGRGPDNDGIGAVAFGMRMPGRTLLARPDCMRVNHVGGASVFWRRSFLGDERHRRDRWGHAADGHLIERMHARHPDRFAFVDEPLVWHNSLEG